MIEKQTRAPPTPSNFLFENYRSRVMVYDFKQEYKKWITEKEKEENLLRKLGVSEETIQELRIIDKNIFNSNRNFYRHENVSNASFFQTQSSNYSFTDMSKLEAVLDNMENELIYEIVSNTDEVTYSIIELMYQGYNGKEISEILGISVYSILRRIKKLKKLL